MRATTTSATKAKINADWIHNRRRMPPMRRAAFPVTQTEPIVVPACAGASSKWVRGWVHVGDPDDTGVRRHLDLRYELSAAVANRYTADGFTTVVQDNIYGPDVERWLERIDAPTKHLVVLRPSIAVVSERDAERQRNRGKVAYRDGFTPAINDEHLASTRRDLGLWLDTSIESPEESVDEILRRADEAIVS
jgi:hypothetical protein